MSAPLTPEGLAAIEEIRALKALYCRALDTKNAALWRSVFTEDLITDMSEAMDEPDSAPSLRGADTFVDATLDLLSHVTTVHQVYAPEIVLTGPDTATGIWAMEDRLWVGADDKSLPYRYLHGWGHYHETYRREADGWRIASLKLTRLNLHLD